MKTRLITGALVVAMMCGGLATAKRAPHRASACSTIPEEQIPESAKQLFALIDADGNGRISKTEMLAFANRNGAASYIIKKRWTIADKDRNGSLSPQETEDAVRYVNSLCRRER